MSNSIYSIRHSQPWMWEIGTGVIFLFLVCLMGVQAYRSLRAGRASGVAWLLASLLVAWVGMRGLTQVAGVVGYPGWPNRWFPFEWTVAPVIVMRDVWGTYRMSLGVNPLLDWAIFGVMLISGLALTQLLYRKWIQGRLTEAEHWPGLAGVRAWLTGGRILAAVLFAWGASASFNLSFLMLLLTLLMLLAAFPLLKSLSGEDSTAPARRGGPSISEERLKVNQMLAEGKISVEESAELLDALGETEEVAGEIAYAYDEEGSRKLMLIGAAALALSMTVPWFSSGGYHNGPILFPRLFGLPLTPTIWFGGSTAVEWTIVGLALAATVLVFREQIDARTRRTGAFLCLAAGVVLVLWVGLPRLGLAGLGFFLAVAGYVIQFVGLVAWRERFGVWRRQAAGN